MWILADGFNSFRARNLSHILGEVCISLWGKVDEKKLQTGDQPGKWTKKRFKFLSQLSSTNLLPFSDWAGINRSRLHIVTWNLHPAANQLRRKLSNLQSFLFRALTDICPHEVTVQSTSWVQSGAALSLTALPGDGSRAEGKICMTRDVMISGSLTFIVYI